MTSLTDFCKVLHSNLDIYWNEHNLSYSDFNCRECGKFMLDVDNIKYVNYKPEPTKFQYKFQNTTERMPYVESEQNRWLVRGRILSGKIFFRHICWDCFFKHLPEIENISKRALKSSWYKDIKNGIIRPPASCSSPSKYFKLLFDITDEELENEHKKFDTASLESFKRRFGEQNGIIEYEKYRARQAYTCSKEYMMKERGMTEEEWNSFNAGRAITKENLIAKHGVEVGEKMWNEYCERQAYAGCKLDYFIEQYGEVEGKIKYDKLNKLKKQTASNFIRKYGEEVGLAKWRDLNRRREQQYSQISQELFETLDKKEPFIVPKSFYASKGDGEKMIEVIDGQNRKCLYPDFLYGNKIIEFYGDYFHANPKRYSDDDMIRNKTAKEVREANDKRTKLLVDAGYQVKIVWEYDYSHSKKKIVKECIEFLKN